MSARVTIAVFLVAGEAFAGSSGYRGYDSGAYWRQQVSADLVVRPDTLTVAFSVRKTTADPNAQVAVLQGIVADVAKRFEAATGSSSSLRMRNLSIDAVSDKQSNEQRSITVEGVIDVPLAADADYWTRAHLFASLTQLCKGVSDELTRRAYVARFERPTAVLKDPEHFRADLMKIWIDRAHGFAAAAQSPQAQLHLLECQPPDRVTQTHLSIEEVALRLQQNCRLDLPRGK